MNRTRVAGILVVAALLLLSSAAALAAAARAQGRSARLPEARSVDSSIGLPRPGLPEIGSRATLTTTHIYLPLVARSYTPPGFPVSPTPAPLPYVLATIQLPPGSHPHGIALDTAGQRAFVGNHLSNSLAVLDTAAMVVASIVPLPGQGPNGVAYHPARDRVYVANRDSNDVSVVDLSSGQVIANPAVGALPDGVAIQDELVYVANFGSNDVSIVDARTNSVTRTIGMPANSHPAMLATDGESGYLFLSLYGDNSIYYLLNGQIWNTRSGVPTPYGLAFDPVTDRLYVADRSSANALTTIDTDYNVVLGTTPLAHEPYVVAANPRTGHIFVAAGDRVLVYDRRDGALLADIPVGAGAEEGIAVDPELNRVYVTCGDADQVAVIQDIATLDLAYISRDESGARLVVADETNLHSSTITSCPGCTLLDLAWRPDGRRLAFASSLDGELDIWTIGAAGASPVNLTADSGDQDQGPSWSPDGTRLVWQRGTDIWMMAADGSQKRRVTIGLTARTPRWSPDGAWIAFVAFGPGGHEDVYIVPSEGDDPIDLTSNPAVDLGPSWAPNSQALAFETNRDTDYSIYRVDISGYPSTAQLTGSPAFDHAPAWSPDGESVAYISDSGNAEYDFALWLVTPDGATHRRLSIALHLLGPLSWSSGSRWLTAQGGLGTGAEIYTFDTASGRVYRLTNDASQQDTPVWRPDRW